MDWRHPIAAGIDDQTGQQTRRLRAHRQCTLLPMNRKLVLDDLPKLRIEDGRVLAGIGCALVNDVAPIDPVLQHQIECPARRRLLRSISKEIQRRRHLPFSSPPSPYRDLDLCCMKIKH
jgi:hypothetical protein